MPTPVTGVAGPGGDRASAGAPTSADVIAEIKARQAERLRSAQAENTKPNEVVEETGKSQGTESATAAAPREEVRPYRVKLDPDTRRLHTEVLNTATGEIIMRIPAGYVDPTDETPPSKDGETRAAPSKEIEA